MSVVDRVDSFQRKHPVLGFPLAVVYKFFDDFGGYLSALLTYYGFVSLFPLLLLLTTVLGILLRDHPDWQERIINSAIEEIPVVGDQLRSTGKVPGSTWGIVVSVLTSIYGGLGVAQAMQYVCNTAWMVPRNSRPNPFASRGRGLLILLTAGLLLLATTVVSALGNSTSTWLGDTTKTLLPFLTVLVNTAVFLLALHIAAARKTTIGDNLPGAFIGAMGWQAIQTFGAIYVGRVVQQASSVSAVFAVVLGLLAFLYLAAVLAVLCVEINVVRALHLYPRALLTPFTDGVELTGADHRAYTGKSLSERYKGYQHIRVGWGDRHDPEPGDHEHDASDLERPRGRTRQTS